MSIFSVKSVPSYKPTKIVQIIKSLTAREIFYRVLTVKKGGRSIVVQRLLHPYGRPSRNSSPSATRGKQGSEQAYTQLHRQDVQFSV